MLLLLILNVLIINWLFVGILVCFSFLHLFLSFPTVLGLFHCSRSFFFLIFLSPDKQTNNDEKHRKIAESKFKLLTESYSVLSDKKKREDFDYERREEKGGGHHSGWGGGGGWGHHSAYW